MFTYEWSYKGERFRSSRTFNTEASAQDWCNVLNGRFPFMECSVVPVGSEAPEAPEAPVCRTCGGGGYTYSHGSGGPITENPCPTCQRTKPVPLAYLKDD